MADPSATQLMPEAVIELHNLSKDFGDGPLVQGANLTVHRGETLAIIGDSGAGKSVLLKLMMGLIDFDEGEVLFKGEAVAEMEQSQLDNLRKQVGYVFQSDALFDSMRVVDNIGYAMREHTEAGDDEIRARAAECLEFVGLERRLLDLYPGPLSGGQKKRVGIARAVAIKPSVLLYDEPTQGLDPQSITRIANLIERLQSDLNATSVVVTHDMRTAFTVADRIALLHEGRFAHIGTPTQFAHTDVEPVREFIADALEELRELPFLRENSPG